jgi:ferredoxin
VELGVKMIISTEECGYCGACVSVCPHNILELSEMEIIAHEGCEECAFCMVVCPLGAIKRGEK